MILKIFQTFDDEYTKQFGCTSIFNTNLPNQTCNVGLFTPENRKIYREMFPEIEKKAWAQCKLPCLSMDIYYGYPILDSNYIPNESFIKLYFKSSVNVKENIFAYTGITLFAEMGGYLGLLLGFSILDLTKVVGFLHIVMAKKSKTTKRHNSIDF